MTLSISPTVTLYSSLPVVKDQMLSEVEAICSHGVVHLPTNNSSESTQTTKRATTGSGVTTKFTVETACTSRPLLEPREMTQSLEETKLVPVD